jgi:hypothetical protein
MASGMSTESSTGLHGIEHGLDERLRGVPLRQPDRGRAARPWDGLWPLGIKKEGPPAAPLFEREFGRLFCRVKLVGTTRNPAVRLEERDQVLGRDTLLAGKAQSVDPTTSVHAGRRHDLDDDAQRVSAVLDLDTEQGRSDFRGLLGLAEVLPLNIDGVRALQCSLEPKATPRSVRLLNRRLQQLDLALDLVLGRLHRGRDGGAFALVFLLLKLCSLNIPTHKISP